MRFAATQSPALGRSTTARPGFVSRFLAVSLAWLNRRAVLAELHSLDERTLADLRIYRGDFQAIAEGSYVREGGAHDIASKSEAGSSAPRRLHY
jgi:uncharacterized protein YjiS (DUF1127 family)